MFVLIGYIDRSTILYQINFLNFIGSELFDLRHGQE